jgi:hypothetical protein
MTRPRDPAELTESERFAEIAELLARGALRWMVGHQDSPSNPENRLDDRGRPEALCGSNALNPRNQEPAA